MEVGTKMAKRQSHTDKDRTGGNRILRPKQISSQRLTKKERTEGGRMLFAAKAAKCQPDINKEREGSRQQDAQAKATKLAIVCNDM